MIGYQSTLLGRTEVAEGTMAFQFEKRDAAHLDGKTDCSPESVGDQ